MEKIRITEEQYRKLIALNESEEVEDEPNEDNKDGENENGKPDIDNTKSKDSEGEDDDEKEAEKENNVCENITRTFGDLDVRNLIKEGNEIHGEVKSSYGVWKNMKWNEKGEAQGFDNVFKRLSYKLEM